MGDWRPSLLVYCNSLIGIHNVELNSPRLMSPWNAAISDANLLQLLSDHWSQSAKPRIALLTGWHKLRGKSRSYVLAGSYANVCTAHTKVIAPSPEQYYYGTTESTEQYKNVVLVLYG